MLGLIHDDKPALIALIGMSIIISRNEEIETIANFFKRHCNWINSAQIFVNYNSEQSYACVPLKRC